jgi:hypothetical protein
VLVPEVSGPLKEPEAVWEIETLLSSRRKNFPTPHTAHHQAQAGKQRQVFAHRAEAHLKEFRNQRDTAKAVRHFDRTR